VLKACNDGVKGGLGGKHTGLDGGMSALDATGVQVAGGAAHQRATLSCELALAVNVLVDIKLRYMICNVK
jgi:hypothetical protein